MTNVRWARAALLALGLSACAHTSSSPHQQTLPWSGTLGAADSVAETPPRAGATNTRYAYLVAGPIYDQELTGAAVADATWCDPWADLSTKLCDLPALATRSTP